MKKTIHYFNRIICSTICFAIFQLSFIPSFAQYYVQKGNDIIGEAIYDQSGFSVSMPNAHTVAIGANYNSGTGLNQGHVRVYEWNDSVWIQKGADIDGEADNDLSGYSVSMPDVNTVAIGAINNRASSGHVRVYEWNGSAWTQKGADIDGDGEAGYGVSMYDANTLAVTAPKTFTTTNGNEAGIVRIYRWNGSAWVQKGTDIEGDFTVQWFGWNISLPDSNTVAISSFNYDRAVKIYEWNGSAWIQKGANIYGDSYSDQAIRINMPDPNTIAIGAHLNDSAGTDAGHVRIYKWDGSAWIQKGIDITGEVAGEMLGRFVSMADSNTVSIANHVVTKVKIFQWNGIAWTQIGNTVNLDSSSIGRSLLSMPDENTFAVGSPRTASILEGRVKVYSFCNATTSNVNVNACYNFISPSGNSYTTSGVYADTITNFGGCDSIIIINLTINNVSDLSTTISGFTISANNGNATYQWLNCDNNYEVIAGETAQLFTATANGNYAIELTENGCVDTSACVSITSVGILENSFGDKLLVYPNPTNGNFSVDLGAHFDIISVTISDINGRLIRTSSHNNTQILKVNISEPAGIYLLKIASPGQIAVIRLKKE